MRTKILDIQKMAGDPIANNLLNAINGLAKKDFIKQGLNAKKNWLKITEVEGCESIFELLLIAKMGNYEV